MSELIMTGAKNSKYFKVQLKCYFVDGYKYEMDLFNNRIIIIFLRHNYEKEHICFQTV